MAILRSKLEEPRKTEVHRQLRMILLKIAVEHGYVDLSSSYDHIEASLQRVVDEHFRLPKWGPRKTA